MRGELPVVYPRADKGLGFGYRKRGCLLALQTLSGVERGSCDFAAQEVQQVVQRLLRAGNQLTVDAIHGLTFFKIANKLLPIFSQGHGKSVAL